MLVCSDWAPLSQPDHLEGPEGGQPGHRLELQPDHAGPEGGGAAPALHHQDAKVMSCRNVLTEGFVAKDSNFLVFQVQGCWDPQAV